MYDVAVLEFHDVYPLREKFSLAVVVVHHARSRGVHSLLGVGLGWMYCRMISPVRKSIMKVSVLWYRAM